MNTRRKKILTYVGAIAGVLVLSLAAARYLPGGAFRDMVLAPTIAVVVNLIFHEVYEEVTKKKRLSATLMEARIERAERIVEKVREIADRFPALWEAKETGAVRHHLVGLTGRIQEAIRLTWQSRLLFDDVLMKRIQERVEQIRAIDVESLPDWESVEARVKVIQNGVEDLLRDYIEEVY